MSTQFSAYKKQLDKELSDYDNANQLLSSRDFATREEAEELADSCRNNPDYCDTVTGVSEVEEDGETFFQVRGRKRVLKLRSLTKIVSNPNATYGYQRDPENYVHISAEVLESESTDGGESPDWYAVVRESIIIH